MAEGDKVRCLGYFGGQCVPENYHLWTGGFLGSAQYNPDAPAEEQLNVVGPGTPYPVGLELKQAMKWYWKAKSWTFEFNLAGSGFDRVELNHYGPVDLQTEVYVNSYIPSGNHSATTSGFLFARENMKDILCGGAVRNFAGTGRLVPESSDIDETAYDEGTQTTTFTTVTYQGVGVTVAMDGSFVKVGNLYYPRITVTGSVGVNNRSPVLAADHPTTGTISSLKSKLEDFEFLSIVVSNYGSTFFSFSAPIPFIGEHSISSAVICQIDGVNVPMFQRPSLTPSVGALAPDGSGSGPEVNALIEYGAHSINGGIRLTIADEF